MVCCDIGTEGAKRIAKALERNWTLKAIHMSRLQEVGDVSWAAPSLMNRDECSIEEEGAARLAKALEKNSTITEINLERDMH